MLFLKRACGIEEEKNATDEPERNRGIPYVLGEGNVQIFSLGTEYVCTILRRCL
jgi:hypothetical protein